MVLLRSIFVLAATATALAMGAASTPTLADEYVANLGPVGPNRPILATFSGQRFLAFFGARARLLRGTHVHVERCRRHHSRHAEPAARRDGSV